jgi:hypothetical protein
MLYPVELLGHLSAILTEGETGVKKQAGGEARGQT